MATTEFELSEELDLTEEQLTFAAREHAVAGVQNHLGVFFYRAEPYSTTRWLVDDHGLILDSAAFRRGW